MPQYLIRHKTKPYFVHWEPFNRYAKRNDATKFTKQDAELIVAERAWSKYKVVKFVRSKRVYATHHKRPNTIYVFKNLAAFRICEPLEYLRIRGHDQRVQNAKRRNTLIEIL